MLARRDVLRSRWPWLGVAIAALLVVPHVWWQFTHGWPIVEFMANARAGKHVDLSPLAFLAEQALQMCPPALPVWLLGLASLLRSRPLRPLGWAYLAILGLMLSTAAKPYYLAPAYTALLAAGGAALDAWLVRRAARVAAVVALAVPGLLAAPLAMPLLPVDTYVRYAGALGLEPGTDERHALGRLPQFFADMHGWPEFAAAVAAVYHALPPADRARACIVGGNYGEAGAIDHFGPALGLPPAISAHNSYHLWGPRDCTGEVVIVPERDPSGLRELFTHVEQAGLVRCGDCMPYENDLPLWVARGPRTPLATLWPSLRHYQ